MFNLFYLFSQWPHFCCAFTTLQQPICTSFNFMFCQIKFSAEINLLLRTWWDLKMFKWLLLTFLKYLSVLKFKPHYQTEAVKNYFLPFPFSHKDNFCNTLLNTLIQPWWLGVLECQFICIVICKGCIQLWWECFKNREKWDHG